MRIICISSSQVPSDTANSIQVMKVCQAFTQLGHTILLLVPGTKPDKIDEISLARHYGIKTPFEVEWITGRSRRWFPWKAVRRAHMAGADLLYCWPFQSAALGLLMGIPAQVEIHDIPSGRFGRLWLRLFLLIPGTKRLLPITTALKKCLHLPENITVVAPDGVDLERYASLPNAGEARKLLGLPPIRTVVCTGHLYPGRGVDLFLHLAGKFPQVNFVWIGGRVKDVKYWREQASLSQRKNVTFTGFVPNENIPMYQAAADVLLMPYQKKVATSSGGNTAQVCSPMKMFEYMASNRVIITSDLTVLREVLDESMAVFCPPDASGEWEKALDNILKDTRRSAELAYRAHEAVGSYSWIARAKKVLQGFL
jgi:glycosyltransferase involved in cell wall biosynthesis